jgi:hypothetical protein
MRQFGAGWQKALKTQGEIVHHAVKGLEENPALVARFGREIDNLFGQYGKYGPRTRAIIQSIAPFLPWYMTAAKYVFWQLPVHHPVASGLLASMRRTVNQDIKDGKQKPLDPYVAQALGTLGPFGIFTPDSGKPADVAKELVSKVTSLGLPEVAGAGMALGGLTPFWTPLKGPGGTVKPMSPQAIEQAGNQLAEAMLPLLNRLRYAREGGRPSYGTSSVLFPQVKPGGGPATWQKILNREANPIYSLQRALNAKRRVPVPAAPSGGGFGSTGFGSSGFGSSSIP